MTEHTRVLPSPAEVHHDPTVSFHRVSKSCKMAFFSIENTVVMP